VTETSSIIGPKELLRRFRVANFDASSELRGFADELGPVSCKRGCDNCCKQKILSTPAEGLSIFLYLRSEGRWSPELEAHLAEEDVYATRTNHADWFKERRPCPFLRSAEARKQGSSDQTGSEPPSLPASAPPGLPASAPPGLPASAPLGLPASAPPSLPASAPPGLPASAPPSLPASAPPSLPASAPPSLPASAPPGGVCGVYPVRPVGCIATFSTGDPEFCGRPDIESRIGYGQMQINAPTAPAMFQLLALLMAIENGIPNAGYMTLPGAVLAGALHATGRPPRRALSLEIKSDSTGLIDRFDAAGKAFFP
jgi:hypothetical protein